MLKYSYKYMIKPIMNEWLLIQGHLLPCYPYGEKFLYIETYKKKEIIIIMKCLIRLRGIRPVGSVANTPGRVSLHVETAGGKCC